MNKLAKLKIVIIRNPLKAGFLLLCIVLFSAVQVWKSAVPLGVSDWNGKAISEIRKIDPEKFAFAVFGDNKDGDALFDALLRDISRKKEASFAVDMGDLVPRGRRREFRSFIGELQDDLNIPLVTVIGNHDRRHGSSRNYREIFGNTYYHFSIGRNEFIVLDASAKTRLDAAQRLWLEGVLEKSQSADNRYVFMHIPPFDPRGEGF